jgi:hypothetical protein
MPLVLCKVIEFLRFSTYKTSITLLYDGLGTPNPSAKIGKRNETKGKNEVFCSQVQNRNGVFLKNLSTKTLFYAFVDKFLCKKVSTKNGFEPLRGQVFIDILLLR